VVWLESGFAVISVVEGKGLVSPVDALIVANSLNDPGAFAPTSAMDITGDGSVTGADFDAIVSALDDVGDGSAGEGDVANIEMAEGEGSEGGGGGLSFIHNSFGLLVRS
jgi:hypothetical protein